MRGEDVDDRLAGHPPLVEPEGLADRGVAHDGAVDEAHDVERRPVDRVVGAEADRGRHRHAVGAKAEMMRCSRPMSWAVARTCPSGGRRSTQRCPASSVDVEGEVRVPAGDERERERGDDAGRVLEEPRGDRARCRCPRPASADTDPPRSATVRTLGRAKPSRYRRILVHCGHRCHRCHLRGRRPGALRRRPVVVDLWAPWCGPCRTLGPILEKSSTATGGTVVLAKVNVDENPQASAAFRVQSIPAVYALQGRQVVDGFVGAQGERAVRQFVDGLLPTEEETEIDSLLAAGDEASLRAALELDPGNERGHRGPGRVAGAARATATRRSACSTASPRRPRPAASPRWPGAGDEVDGAEHHRQARRAARPGQGRRRRPPGVRRPARAAGPRRSPHRGVPAPAHRPPVLIRAQGASRRSGSGGRTSTVDEQVFCC